MSGITEEKKPEEGQASKYVRGNKEAESKPVEEAEGDEGLRFSPEEEAALLQESQASKSEANSLFVSKQYQHALDKYDAAMSVCPRYLHYDRAVIQSNVAACHLKLEQWKDAMRAASDALDGLAKLEREDPRLKPPSEEAKKKEEEEGDVEEEIVSSGASRSAHAPPQQQQTEADTLRSDVQRIRSKALMRRARARAEAGGWQNLAGAEEDYKTLSAMASLAPADMRIVRTQLRDLPPRTKAAQEKEMGEMWGKLKDLGNGILKPFGLSTENFQMVKDENTGGYSMNFNQGAKPS